MSIAGILKIMEVQEDDMEVQEEAVEVEILKWAGLNLTFELSSGSLIAWLGKIICFDC